LCDQYTNSHEFKRLDKKTQRQRQRVLNTICDQPIGEAGGMTIGEATYAKMTSKAVRRLRDRKADTPAAANDWLKGVKAMFKWAGAEELSDHNPAKDVAKLKIVSAGFHTWTEQEVEQYEAKYPIGTTQRLALALLLYTGQRRSDVILFGSQHVKDGWLHFTQQKNRNSKPVTLEIPVLPQLAEILEASKNGHLTFLVSKQGKPFSEAGFGMRFREWCDAAGLPHCTAHGLRKAGASRAAENGATTSALMAIFGWSDIKQAEIYTRKADQKRIAGSNMHLIRGDKG
jgi:integrase